MRTTDTNTGDEMMLTAYIGIQNSGRVYLTIRENDKVMLHERVSSRAIAELKINALEEARKEQIRTTVETNL